MIDLGEIKSLEPNEQLLTFIIGNCFEYDIADEEGSIRLRFAPILTEQEILDEKGDYAEQEVYRCEGFMLNTGTGCKIPNSDFV